MVSNNNSRKLRISSGKLCEYVIKDITQVIVPFNANDSTLISSVFGAGKYKIDIGIRIQIPAHS